MDSYNNQFNTYDDNDEPFDQYKDQCESFFWSRKFFSESVDISNMSKEILCLYKFNKKILDLTDEMIEGLLSIGDLQNILNEEDLFFSIIDPSDCTTLNKFCLNLNLYFLEYQKQYIKSKKKKDYICLLDSVLKKLYSFVAPTLPIIEKNIDNLIFKVRRNGKYKFNNIETKKVENVGNKINKVIYEYLKDLYQTVNKFKISEVSIEISEMKNDIEDMIKNTFKKKSIAMGISVFKKVTTTNEPPVKQCCELYPFDNPSEIEDEDFEVGETESQTEIFYERDNSFLKLTDNYGQYIPLNSHKSSINENFSHITAEDDNTSVSQTNLTVIALSVGAIFFLICSLIFGFKKWRISKRKRRNVEDSTHPEDDAREPFNEYFISK